MKSFTAPDLSKHTNYGYKFDLGGDTSAAAIVRFVAPKSKVLDIGAGSGSITRQLVISKKCNVTAVENNPAAVKKLEAFCKSVHALDLNSEAWADDLTASRLQQGLHTTFDYVIAGDVLEHLYDPWTVVKKMASLLNPEGRAIISVPHSGHSVVVAAFLTSDIDLRESGILDKTHIRFFGLRNIDILNENAGLSITRIHNVIRRPEQTEFANLWKSLPETTRQTLAERKFANVYQVVTEAARHELVENPISLAEGDAQNLNSDQSRGWKRLLGRLTARP